MAALTVEQDEQSMVTQLQAAMLLGVTPDAINKLVADNRLKVHLRVFGGIIIPFYDETELVRLKQQLQAQQQTPPDPIETFKLLLRILDRIQHSPKSSDSYKGALTIEGASNLSGLSDSTLLRDINAGKLKAKKIGGQWRIKRVDFFSYLQKEWNKD